MNDIPQPEEADVGVLREFNGTYLRAERWNQARDDLQNEPELAFRRYILAQVSNDGDALQLFDSLRGLNHTTVGDFTLAAWLKAFLRVNRLIPECILDAARTSTDDSGLELNNPHQAILKRLQEIRSKDADGFRGLEYTSTTNGPNGTGHAHYIGKPKFRHGGDPGAAPSTVFISEHPVTETEQPLVKNVVRVYHQESGSGKTVELAASAYTRDALFTIMITLNADVKLITDGHVGLHGVDDETERTNTRKAYRRRDALRALTNAVKATWDKGLKPDDFLGLKDLISFIKELDGKRKDQGGYGMATLHIVVAIDEAGSQPNLVKAVIRDYEDFGTTLGRYIMCGCDFDGSLHQVGSVDEGATPAKLKVEGLEDPLKTLTVNVLFSIAGTGASQGTVGSVASNFIHLKPSAKAKPEEVYDILRQAYTKGITDPIIPQYGELKQFPLLKALVDSNARMISVYMNCAKTLQKNNENTNKKANTHAQEQGAILAHTFAKFMASNGMFSLSNEASFARLTAHRAIAVLLFQQTTSFPHGLKDIHVSEMDYGISFERVNEDDKNKTIMQKLVAEYGLVTAKPFRAKSENKPVAKPFELSGAMQLLCLWLIQGGTQAPTDKSFLGTTSTSFETLTGLLVSAAIGASSVVKKDKHGRVLAAPALGYNHGTTVQQEADIFSALRKVGMTVKKTNAGNPVAAAAAASPSSSYTCGTTGGPKPVAEIVGDQFWSLKGAHAVFLLEGPRIPGVYFNKSMMTSVTTVADQNRITDAVVQKKGAAFNKMNKAQFGEGGTLQVTPLARVPSDEMQATLSSNHSILADEELLRICGKLQGVGKLLSGSTMATATHSASTMDTGDSNDTTTDDVKDTYVLPFTTIADGNSKFADAYVTFLVKPPGTDSSGERPSLRTMCIQAKDYAKDTSPDMLKYLKNGIAVTSPELDPLFGEDRIFTVAGAKSTVAWGYTGGEFPYVPFVVENSTILKNQMVSLSQGRQQTAKQGEYAAFLPGPTTDATSSTQDADESLNAQFDPPGETKKRSNERGQDASDNDNVNPPKKQKPST